MAWRAVVEGLLLGGAVGGVTGLAVGGLIALVGVAAGDGAGAVGLLLLGVAAGLLAGVTVGLLAGAGAVLALAAATGVLRLTGRHLTRAAGTVVVPLAVVLTPLLVAAGTAAAGEPVALRAAGLALLPLLCGAALATWRYRALTRPGPPVLPGHGARYRG